MELRQATTEDLKAVAGWDVSREDIRGFYSSAPWLLTPFAPAEFHDPRDWRDLFGFEGDDS